MTVPNRCECHTCLNERVAELQALVDMGRATEEQQAILAELRRQLGDWKLGIRTR